MNVVRFYNVRGGYTYHPASWFQIAGDTPLYVPLAWGFILSTSRVLTDRFRMQFWARPFCDALLTLLIDASLDVVAIRLHFWNWRGIGRREGFFGVPADNFLGWMLVSFSFSILSRGLESLLLAMRLLPPSSPSNKASTLAPLLLHWLILPVVAFIVYLALERTVGGCYFLFHAVTLQQQLWVLLAYIILFLGVVGAGVVASGRSAEEMPEIKAETGQFELMTHFARSSFHLFGIFGLLYLTLVGANPEGVLWVVAGVVGAIELGVGALSVKQNRGHAR